MIRRPVFRATLFHSFTVGLLLPGNGREINLFDLATHHSGLSNLPSNPCAGDTGNLSPR